MAEEPGPGFGMLLRQLRGAARLTQEDLAQAAGVSPRTVSDLERGINRTAHRDTAVLLANALRLTGPVRELFVAAARGRAPAAEVLTAVREAAAAAPAEVGGEGAALAARQAELVRALVDSPYQGLAAFEEQDAGLFFGREAAAGQVLARLAAHARSGGLLMVSGVSGVGKSSLLRAGVLPRLRAAGLDSVPGSGSWPCLVLTPGRAPLDELALGVATLAGADAAVVRRGLESDPGGFALTVRQAARATQQAPAGGASGAPPGPGGPAGGGSPQEPRLVLIVDQFEQVFTQCPSEREREAFITAVHAAATTRHGPGQAPAALAAVCVRADFESRCADYPQLAGAVQDRYLVTALTGRQLRMAITEPAKKAGSRVDDDLADALLAEMRTRQPGVTGAGKLPLLSHALDQAWRTRTGHTLTLADYEQAGGIEGAVADSAQRAYDLLSPAQQTTARHVFIRLVATTADEVDTAGRATKAELTEGKTTADAEDVEAVLEAFAAERLLTLAAGTIEISHEALLTAWPLLREVWLADTHADRIVRTRLHTTAGEWHRHGHDPAYLYTGTLLQAATSTATRITADPTRHPPLTQTEQDFLHAGNHAQRRRARGRQAAIAGLVVLTLTAIVIAGIAVHNAAVATRQHTLALSRQLAAESLAVAPLNSVIARRLAVAAWGVFPTDQAGAALMTLLAEQQQNGILPADPSGVSDVAFSPNGKLLASGDGNGTVRLWNPVTGQATGTPMQTGSGAQGGVTAVAFSPNGKLLASADANGTVRLWNPVTGHPIGAPLQQDRNGAVESVAFSPNGKLLASEDDNATVRVWNAVTRQPLGAPIQTNGNVIGLSFSPSGMLVAVSKNMFWQWDPVTHHGAPLLAGPSARRLFVVAFSPNRKLLATVSADATGTVQLWNPVTRQPLGAPLHATGSQTGGSDVDFSPNGKLLATADSDGTVELWNPVTGKLAGAPLDTGALSGVLAVAFSRDGKWLASAGSDGTLQLWRMSLLRHPYAALCADVGPPTPQDWAKYAPAEPQPKICAPAQRR